MAMLAIALVAALLVSAAEPVRRPDSAISCRLQVSQEEQKPADTKSAPAPFVIRFDEASPPTAPLITDHFSIYDPQNLLGNAKPAEIHLLQGAVKLTTQAGGPAGVREVWVINFDQARGPGGPVRQEMGLWLGSIDGVKYHAAGRCHYVRNAALLNDKALVQKAK
jgi:hypothetical protein